MNNGLDDNTRNSLITVIKRTDDALTQLDQFYEVKSGRLPDSKLIRPQSSSIAHSPRNSLSLQSSPTSPVLALNEAAQLSSHPKHRSSGTSKGDLSLSISRLRDCSSHSLGEETDPSTDLSRSKRLTVLSSHESSSAKLSSSAASVKKRQRYYSPLDPIATPLAAPFVPLSRLVLFHVVLWCSKVCPVLDLNPRH